MNRRKFMEMAVAPGASAAWRNPRGIEPPERHQRRVLYRAPGMSVVDFRCTAHGEGDGPEEPNPTHSIALVRRGVFRRTDRGSVLLADANHALFFNAGQLYRYSHPTHGGDHCTILTIATPQARELVASHSPRDVETAETPFRLGHALISARIVALHYELLRLMKRPLMDLAAQDLVAELANETVRAAYLTHEALDPLKPVSASGRRRRRELVEETKLAINRRLDCPPSLHDLAASLGCSAFYLSRSFRAGAGVSLRGYVKRLRSNIAAHHLARGIQDLTHLALELGYSDHSHFTSAFRAEFGMPPSSFRSLYRRR